MALPETFAWNCRVPFGGKLAVAGVTVTARFEFTLRTRGGDETAPGPGLATVMLLGPTVDADPVAFNWVEETNWVVNGLPFNKIRAPLTKRLPLTARLKGPIGTLFGVSDVVEGIGLLTVTNALARTLGFATLVAVTVNDAKFGNGFAGAVYLPVLLMVPIKLALTPAGGVSDQVTVFLTALVTVAVNCRTTPTGTKTFPEGLIDTVTAAITHRGGPRAKTMAKSIPLSILRSINALHTAVNSNDGPLLSIVEPKVQLAGPVLFATPRND